MGAHELIRATSAVADAPLLEPSSELAMALAPLGQRMQLSGTARNGEGAHAPDTCRSESHTSDHGQQRAPTGNALPDREPTCRDGAMAFA